MIEFKWLILLFIVGSVFRLISHFKCSQTSYRWKYYKDNEFFGMLSTLIYWFLTVYLVGYYTIIPFFNWFNKI